MIAGFGLKRNQELIDYLYLRGWQPQPTAGLVAQWYWKDSFNEQEFQLGSVLIPFTQIQYTGVIKVRLTGTVGDMPVEHATIADLHEHIEEYERVRPATP